MERLIGDEKGLDALCAQLARARLVGIDTEFVRERTYYPRLCLVQVSTDEVTACVDCLAGLDLAPFFAGLARAGLTWVLHSGRQDLEIIRQHAGVLPAAVIDTQIAAALTGRAAQIGLREILASILDVDIGKEHTRSDWSLRPLPDGALRYALDDVRYLPALWRRLEDELAALGRLDWLAEDSARLVRDAEREDLLPIWSRLKGVQGLGEDEQAAALALVGWREHVAARLDRPRRWIMSDELLMRIAQARPESTQALSRVPEMPKRLAQRHGEDILAVVGGRSAPEHALELRRAGTGERPDKDLVKGLQNRIKGRARELGVEPEVLASRRDLLACLRGATPEHLRSGWRAREVSPLIAAATAPNGAR